MTNNEINFVREQLDEISTLRNSIEHWKSLVEAEKRKTETEAALCQKYIVSNTNIQMKFTALCHCINSLAINDWKRSTPTKCKEFLVGLKDDIEKCIREHDIRFNADGVAE